MRRTWCSPWRWSCGVELVDTGRYDVILTRDDDSFVRLRDRLQIARASERPPLSLASCGQPRQRHGRCMVPPSTPFRTKPPTKRRNGWPASENRADILGGIDLSHHEPLVTQILIDLAQRDANNKSLRESPRSPGRARSATSPSFCRKTASAGRLRGLEIAGHALSFDRARLSLQPEGRAPADRSGPSRRPCQGHGARHRSLFRGTPVMMLWP